MSQGDDDFELLNSRPFFGWEEAKRDEVMGRAVYQQAANLRAIKATQAADAARMRAELSQLSGSVENRLAALTRSFGAFVELDAARQQLAAFPEHVRARRLALNDLMALRAGQAPPERPDIEGYWLPPAVAALQPGGGSTRPRRRSPSSGTRGSTLPACRAGSARRRPAGCRRCGAPSCVDGR
ncbi:hypothetical protein G7085_16950 [Tessaracoccus sp. HDW20]|uniref:hypothetical protein n=1 Tax=Tessaracoccus coleopterorum TaxID=2714950 RepID=UPI0018D45A35|nr:hypothetical protein [Tessaracoccus coleopterorum]NHB85709.1 hypothetical protein [Tessaracoccus coleopterorum]